MKLCAFADEASPMLSGQISALLRNGISYLEIRGVNGKSIKDITAKEAQEIQKALSESGISVWSIGSPIGKIRLSDDFEANLDDFKRILESAEIFGATHIRMFSFYLAPDMETQRAKQLVFERIEKLLSLTPPHVTLCHENEKDIFGEQAEQCLMLHQEFPKLRAVFDPANFIQSGVDTQKAWTLLKPYVEYLHIKDAIADGTVVPSGMGVGKIREIVSEYRALGGEILTLEPHLFHFTGLSALENGNVRSLGISPYRDNDEAFDVAASALKSILKDME